MGDNYQPLRPQNSMFYGALLLTLGSIAMRFVQMIFQVYISGVMGAGGLGRMQLIMTVGGFAAILASGGVRIAVTCLAAEEAGKENASGVRTAVRCCGIYGLALSLCVGFCLYILSDFLAQTWVEDSTAALPLRVLALFLPVNCLWSVLAGYFTAAGRITELVSLEFFERLLSIGLVVVLLRTGSDVLDPCLAIFLGSSLATTISFLFLFWRYRQSIRYVTPMPLGPMMRRLFRLTIPLGLNDILRSGLGTLENILVPKGLKKSGRSGTESLAAYGTICGMVFPVITFPSVILYSLSDLLVPEMARNRAKGRTERIQFLADKCLRLTMLFATGTAGLCFLLGEELGLLLFSSLEAGVYIRVFAPLILLLYVDAITDGMLKGLSQQIHSVRYNTITSILDVAMIYLLLPKYGIGGFLAAFAVSHALNFYLSLRRLIIVTGYLPRFRATIQAALCCGLSLLIMNLWPSDGSLSWTLLRGCGFLLLYTLLSGFVGALARDDLIWLRSLILRKKSARNS